MASTLQSELVSIVLQRLANAEKQDPAAFADTGLSAFPSDLDTAQRADLFKNFYMSMSEAGELLYLLTRATGARTSSSTEHRLAYPRSTWPAPYATMAAAP